MREWLKDLRTSNGFSQSEMADKLGITQSYYSMIECGSRKEKLDTDLLISISDTFHIPIEEIIQMEKSKSG